MHTDWTRNWSTKEYFESHSFHRRNATSYLIETGVGLERIDSYNIDYTDDGSCPAHTLLLNASIPICEHLCNLVNLPKTAFRFHVDPLEAEAFGVFTVQAYAVLIL